MLTKKLARKVSLLVLLVCHLVKYFMDMNSQHGSYAIEFMSCFAQYDFLKCCDVVVVIFAKF